MDIIQILKGLQDSQLTKPTASMPKMSTKTLNRFHGVERYKMIAFINRWFISQNGYDILGTIKLQWTLRWNTPLPWHCVAIPGW